MADLTLTDAQASALLWAILDRTPTSSPPEEYGETLRTWSKGSGGSEVRALNTAWEKLFEAESRHRKKKPPEPPKEGLIEFLLTENLTAEPSGRLRSEPSEGVYRLMCFKMRGDGASVLAKFFIGGSPNLFEDLEDKPIPVPSEWKTYSLRANPILIHPNRCYAEFRVSSGTVEIVALCEQLPV